MTSKYTAASLENKMSESERLNTYMKELYQLLHAAANEHKQGGELLLQFMQRVDLKGAEAPAFQKAVESVQKIAGQLQSMVDVVRVIDKIVTEQRAKQEATRGYVDDDDSKNKPEKKIPGSHVKTTGP